MGKVKKAPEAMARMNYLYQAANLVKKSGGKKKTSISRQSAFARRVLSTNLVRLKSMKLLCTYTNDHAWYINVREKVNKQYAGKIMQRFH